MKYASPPILPFLARLPVPLFAVLPLIVAALCGFRLKRTFLCLFCLLLAAAFCWLPHYAVKPYSLANEVSGSEWAELSAFLTNLLKSENLSDFSSHPPLCPTVRKAPFSGLLRNFSIAGIFIPLTGEAFVSDREPALTLPFVSFHEQAHQLGLADEGQASIHAYRACMLSGNTEARISGALVALKYVLIAWKSDFPSDAAHFTRSLSPELYSALDEIGAFQPSQQNTRAFPAFAGDYGDLAKGLICLLRNDLL